MLFKTAQKVFSEFQRIGIHMLKVLDSKDKKSLRAEPRKDFTYRIERPDTKLIAELMPTSTMTDRASAELKASRLVIESERVNPTCGEHGALVNPLGASTKAMDKVVSHVDM